MASWQWPDTRQPRKPNRRPVYFYLYDSELQDRKYHAEVMKIEARVNALGIQGRTEKITILKNIHEAVREGLKRGATTLVIVGNDKTITTLLPDLLETNVAIGIIPVGEPQTIANFLGVPLGAAACDVISRRVVERVDVGQANNHYFLLNAKLPVGAAVNCDGQFSVTSASPEDQMVITNLETSGRVSNPADGQLELVVQGSQKRGWGPFAKDTNNLSVFPIKEAKVTATSGHPQLLLDGQITVPTPLTLTLAKKKLTIIVGRQRHF